MIELHAQKISEPQLLAVFSYSCLNLYNSTYANVRFLPVTATHNYNYLQELCVFLSEDFQCLDVVPPQLAISIPYFLGVGYKDEEDEESLEGHHDGVDVGQRDQFLNFHYQHSRYPR